MMGFTIRQIDKAGNDSVIEEINQDHHNGDCTFLRNLDDHEMLNDNLKYLVVDFNDHLVLIYP